MKGLALYAVFAIFCTAGAVLIAFSIEHYTSSEIGSLVMLALPLPLHPPVPSVSKLRTMDTAGLVITTHAYLSPRPWNIGEGRGADAGQASSVALAGDQGVQASCQKGRRTEVQWRCLSA